MLSIVLKCIILLKQWNVYIVAKNTTIITLRAFALARHTTAPKLAIAYAELLQTWASTHVRRKVIITTTGEMSGCREIDTPVAGQR